MNPFNGKELKTSYIRNGNAWIDLMGSPHWTPFHYTFYRAMQQANHKSELRCANDLHDVQGFDLENNAK